MTNEEDISPKQLKVVGIILLMALFFCAGFFIRETSYCKINTDEQILKNAEYFIFNDTVSQRWAARGMLPDDLTIGDAKLKYLSYQGPARSSLSLVLGKICYGEVE